MTEVPAYSIGLPEEWVSKIKEQSGVRHIAQSDYVPNLYSFEGQSYLESPSTPGRYLKPNIILWYGYYPDSEYSRMALALSNTPTYPNIRYLLPFDNKMMSVVLAMAADRNENRGFILPESLYNERLIPNTVLKWGNSHCGENKDYTVDGTISENSKARIHSVMTEPFIEGESHRMLIVGPHLRQLKYESKDWRKNVGSTIYYTNINNELLSRTSNVMRRYNLELAGFDYIISKDRSPMLLEINTYPSLDEDETALGVFLEMASNAVIKANC